MVATTQRLADNLEHIPDAAVDTVHVDPKVATNQKLPRPDASPHLKAHKRISRGRHCKHPLHQSHALCAWRRSCTELRADCEHPSDRHKGPPRSWEPKELESSGSAGSRQQVYIDVYRRLTVLETCCNSARKTRPAYRAARAQTSIKPFPPEELVSGLSRDMTFVDVLCEISYNLFQTTFFASYQSMIERCLLTPPTSPQERGALGEMMAI